MQAPPLRAQPGAPDYPTREVRLIVPFPAGGSTDSLARLIAPKLADVLGQPVLVDNRSGGNGIVGTQLLASARPDGYTLALVYTTHSTNPSRYSDIPYDAQKDFAPVIQVSTSPLVLVVHPSLAARSVKELIALAKAKPRALKLATLGDGTAGHLAGIMLRALAGIEIVLMPYKGNSPAKLDLVDGRVHFMFDSAPAARPMVHSGKLRALAVTSASRSPAWLELPAMAETLAGFEVNAWSGVLAPARTPQRIVDKLWSAILAVLQQPETGQRMTAEGAEIVGSTPLQFKAFIAADIARWTKVVKAAGAD
jgi:tripartite-type tricarboxylate transporter receptor subunit TctC